MPKTTTHRSSNIQNQSNPMCNAIYALIHVHKYYIQVRTVIMVMFWTLSPRALAVLRMYSRCE